MSSSLSEVNGKSLILVTPSPNLSLGFLPGSNRKVKTQDYTSNKAILEAYKILDGKMLVACYIQHEGGYEEYENLILSLKENNISFILEDDFSNKEKLIIINKY